MDNEQLLLAISDMMDKKLEPVNSRLDRMEDRLGKLETQVAALKVEQHNLRKEIKEVDRKVSETYQLALDAWGRSMENRHWLENSKVTF